MYLAHGLCGYRSVDQILSHLSYQYCLYHKMRIYYIMHHPLHLSALSVICITCHHACAAARVGSEWRKMRLEEGLDGPNLRH
jgi:hypothetical protein